MKEDKELSMVEKLQIEVDNNKRWGVAIYKRYIPDLPEKEQVKAYDLLDRCHY